MKKLQSISLKQLLTLNAIVKEGGCKAAAILLCRSHASVLATIKKLEEILNFEVLDRTGYRLRLSVKGVAFFNEMQPFLQEYRLLQNKITTLEKTTRLEFRIVFGDITPLSLLNTAILKFKTHYPEIQLNLLTENIMGPPEVLLDNKADIMIHHIDHYDTKYEVIYLNKVKLIPVVSKDFLLPDNNHQLNYHKLKKETQCIIRCTAKHSNTKDYFIVDNAPKIIVDNQWTKKSIIMSGIAWGHLPDYLINTELETGELISIANDHVKTFDLDIVAARKINKTHHFYEQGFWDYLKEIFN